MDPTDSQITPSSQIGPARQSRMAITAVVLSIFSFVPPFGIAAVVFGHIARRRITASKGSLNGRAAALAALIIGYMQLSLMTLAVLFFWRSLRLMVQDLRADAMVQSVLRESDAKRKFDSASAHEQETTARSLMIQMLAIEEERHRTGREYLCSPGKIAAVGMDGFTAAEKQALAERLQQSAYVYEVRNCATANGEPPSAFQLTAVPRRPQMPEDSMVFCADETGTLKQLNGGTSDDCTDHGYVVVKPDVDFSEQLPMRPTLPHDTQKPPPPCSQSEKIPCEEWK